MDGHTHLFTSHVITSLVLLYGGGATWAWLSVVNDPTSVGFSLFCYTVIIHIALYKG